MVFHHEQAAAPKFPSRLMFYCERPASVGGGTGITPSWPIVDALAASHPDFLAMCEEKGVRYSAVLPPEPDASKGVGRSWKSFFAVSDKAAAEARMRELGYEWEWTEGDVLRTRTPVLSAVQSVPGPAGPATRVFFNQMVAQALANAKEFDAAASTGPGDVAPPLLCFGDGTPVPMEPLRCAAAVGEARAVDVQWQAGDVLVADNMTVLHARRAFEGPRRVLASLVQ